MYLILFTIIYCVITRILNLEDTLVLGMYVIGAGIIKGIFSNKLNDVFNIRKTRCIYEKVGFKNSLTELISLVLIFANYLLIDYKPFSFFEFIYIILVLILVYRFLFWNIILPPSVWGPILILKHFRFYLLLKSRSQKVIFRCWLNRWKIITMFINFYVST